MASFVAEHNNVYSNYAHGIWCDIDCKNVTYSDNRVHDNDRVGLLFEISDGAKISGNIVWENGWGNANSGWGAGIMAASSSNVEIYNNTLAWNNSGISVVSQDRGESRWNTVRNISVHDNTILAKDYPDGPGHFALRWWQSGYAGVLFDPTSDNRGADNRYWYPGPEGEPRYSWGGTDYRSLARFDTTPGEQNAYYLTDAQKDHVLSVAKIPASPKERPCSTLFARITPRLGFVSDLLWNLYIKLGLYKC
jgi:parallel beta-helix repeat protein